MFSNIRRAINLLQDQKKDDTVNMKQVTETIGGLVASKVDENKFDTLV